MELIERLREFVRTGPSRSQRIREIAEGTGVSEKTVSNAYYGAIHDMRHSNASRIERFLNERYGRRAADQQSAAQQRRGQMR